MSVSIENTSTLGRKIDVTIPPQDVTQAYQEELKKLSKQANLKGFRPGKVPLKHLEQKYGPSVRAEVIQKLVQDKIENIIDENRLRPAGQPQIENFSAKDNQPVTFTLLIEEFPVIDLAPLGDVSLEKNKVEIDEDAITQMKNKLAEANGDWQAVDEAAKWDDRVKCTVKVINLDKAANAAKDGQAPDDENDPIEYSHDNIDLIVAKNHELYPGVNELLVDKAKGATFELETTKFPADKAEQMSQSNDKLKLTVEVHQVERKQPMPIKELVEKFGAGVETEDDLNNKIKQGMEEEANRVILNQVQEKVLEHLLEKNEFELPQNLVDAELNSIVREKVKQENKTEADIRADEAALKTMTEDAHKRVKLGLLINAVVDKYNIKPEGKRLRSEVEYLARRFPEPERVVELYFSNETLLNSVERVVLLNQAVEKLLEEFNIQDKVISFDALMNPKTDDKVD